MKLASAFDSETRALLLDGISRFGRAHPAGSPAAGSYDGSLWQGLAENGWLALGVPETWGGSGAAVGDLLPLMRAAGEGLWRAPLIETLGLACGALLAAPPTPPRDDLLQRMSRGTAIVGLAGPATDASAVQACSSAGGACIVNGHVSPAVLGRVWDVILVSAVIDRDIGLFAVDTNARGVTRDDLETIDGRPVATFVFKETPATALAAGTGVFRAGWRRGHVLAAAESAGLARAALDATVRYLGLRRQFNQPLLEFQAIRHRLVEMHIRACELEAMLETACMAYDTAQPDLDVLILRLRAQCAAAATWITRQAIQLHGGMGMTQELPIGAYYKRALFIDSQFGSHADAIDRLAIHDFQSRES